jgi:hypothetical protein
MKNCIINKVNRIFIQYEILVKIIFYDKVNSFLVLGNSGAVLLFAFRILRISILIQA